MHFVDDLIFFFKGSLRYDLQETCPQHSNPGMEHGSGGVVQGAPQAQCARSATIWASGRTRDPYFEILGAPRGIMVTRSGGFEF